jgi:lysophospholipase L1-like esterase
VVFVLLIWAVVLVASELAWRTYLCATGRGFFDDPNKFTSPFFTTYEEPPPLKWGTTAWYRNGQVSFAKQPKEIRIICFGGSTTVNFRAGISYPELIERRLAAKFPAHVIHVLNAGGEGYSTAHTLVNLSLRNLEVEPDIITVYHNINDLSVREFGEHVESDYGNKYKTNFYLDFRHRIGLIASLTSVSRLARMIFSKIDVIAFPDDERTTVSHGWNTGIKYFTFNLQSISAVARAHGIRVLMASQAARDDVRRDPGFVAYNETVRRVTAENGDEFVDIASAVTEDDMFLPDAIHNTRRGVERVAEVLYPALEKMVGAASESRGRPPE